jgi:hypothetical protein
MNPGLKLANAVGVPAKHPEARTPRALTILKQNANGVHYSEAKTRTAFIF